MTQLDEHPDSGQRRQSPMMVPEILLLSVPENLRLPTERSQRDDLGDNYSDNGDPHARADVEVQPCNQGEMIPQLKRHEIQVLLKAGFTAKDTAERSGVSVDTVRRVHAEDPVVHTDNAAARAGRRIGRPSKAASFTERITKWVSVA
jgi:hypothetical protein